MKSCTESGCEGKYYGRGWCQPHYDRWYRSGQPTTNTSQRGLTLEQRLKRRATTGGGCWLWTGPLSDGYGQIKVNGKMRPAHVVAYELHVGPVPEGMLLDHRCRIRHCVRPDHLRPVTNKQNLENLSGANRNNMTSGVRGVSWHKNTQKWIAQIGHNYKKYYIGIFDTIAEAEAAVIAKRNELFTHNDADRRAA